MEANYRLKYPYYLVAAWRKFTGMKTVLYLFAPSDHFEIMLEIEIISEIMFEVIFVLK